MLLVDGHHGLVETVGPGDAGSIIVANAIFILSNRQCIPTIVDILGFGHILGDELGIATVAVVAENHVWIAHGDVVDVKGVFISFQGKLVDIFPFEDVVAG